MHTLPLSLPLPLIPTHFMQEKDHVLLQIWGENNNFIEVRARRNNTFASMTNILVRNSETVKWNVLILLSEQSNVGEVSQLHTMHHDLSWSA